jgi:alpha-tubulin suppressor-like RCC1 family protein
MQSVEDIQHNLEEMQFKFDNMFSNNDVKKSLTFTQLNGTTYTMIINSKHIPTYYEFIKNIRNIHLSLNVFGTNLIVIYDGITIIHSNYLSYIWKIFTVIENQISTIIVSPWKISVCTNMYTIAILNADGIVVTWGVPDNGGITNTDTHSLIPTETALKSSYNPSFDRIEICKVEKIYSNWSSFAAIKSDGSVVTWGRSEEGGESYSVQSKLKNVIKIYSTSNTFTALKEDGSVVTWGFLMTLNGRFGSVELDENLNSNIKFVVSTAEAFAALKNDNSVITWGYNNYGGDSSYVINDIQSDVIDIVATDYAFAALKIGGRVITWGCNDTGGDSNCVITQLSSGVVKIYNTNRAFAALKDDGSVVTWGSVKYGGNSAYVQHQLKNIKEIFSNTDTFVALTNNGTVVMWGQMYKRHTKSITQLTNIKKVFSNTTAFAALTYDGNVFTWGNHDSGGDSEMVKDQLKNVKEIFSTTSAFAALTDEGSVITWGNDIEGGNSSQVTEHLCSDVEYIYSNIDTFIAVKTDDTIISWGALSVHNTNINLK